MPGIQKSKSRIIPISVFLFAAFALCRLVSGDDTQLIEAGIPALSRTWSGIDYPQTAEVLIAGKLPLPRFSDEQGNRFLQRLTSLDNLSIYRNHTLPLEQRMGDYLKLMDRSSRLSKLYMAAVNKGLDVHREVCQLLAFQLRVAEIGVQLADEFLPTIPKDDRYAVRMDGVKQFNAGLTGIFVGAEVSLSEKNFYSSEDLSLFLRTMAETLPTVKKAFSPDYVLELRKKLESRKIQFSGKEDQNNIQKMIDVLAKAPAS